MDHSVVTEKHRERDKTRPIRVHCIGLLVQRKTGCADADAIEVAWDIYDYMKKTAKSSNG